MPAKSLDQAHCLLTPFVIRGPDSLFASGGRSSGNAYNWKGFPLMDSQLEEKHLDVTDRLHRRFGYTPEYAEELWMAEKDHHHRSTGAQILAKCLARAGYKPEAEHTSNGQEPPPEAKSPPPEAKSPPPESPPPEAEQSRPPPPKDHAAGGDTGPKKEQRKSKIPEPEVHESEDGEDASESTSGVNDKGNQKTDGGEAKERKRKQDAAAYKEAIAYQLAQSIDAYYDQPRKEYLLHEGNERYQPLSETQFKRRLRFHQMSTKALDFCHYSQVDVVLRELQQKKYVDYAGALAGKERGYYFENGIPILVTYSPQLIIPKPGNWDTLRRLLSNLYWGPDEAHADDQRHVFYGWVQVAFNALRVRRWQPGQALAFAGPSDAGKSLTQRLITMILGGRSAKAALFLQQRTDFNGEMFEAEHLMLEDEAASTRYKDRLAFAAQLKQIAANQVQPCHPKNRQIVNLCPWWRVTISLNDEPDRLLVLPPLSSDVADKLILLRASQASMPMLAETPEQKTAFWKRLNDELPAFLHYIVNEYKIPKDWRSTRFGIKEFQHPALLTALEELDPAMLLLELIDTANIWHQWDPKSQVWGTTIPWEGSALELRRVLSNKSATQRDASSLLSYTNATGRYLNKLAKIRATRVKFTHTKTGDRYEIYP
jgi:hypothetical protein